MGWDCDCWWRATLSGEMSGEDRDRTLAWLQPESAAALLSQSPEVTARTTASNTRTRMSGK
jgi:hypothetical protein